MGLISRAFKFTLGAATGAAAGAAFALLLAPDSGQELQQKLRQRIREAKAAGEAAQASKEAELIRKFRGEVNDPTALSDVEREVSQSRASAGQPKPLASS